MKEFTLTSFTNHLAEMAANTVLALNAGLHAAAKTVETDAKAKIGHFQGDVGPFSEWPELATYTEEEKERLGYVNASGYDYYQPLLRTGDLRNSIVHEVAGLEAVVGSKSPIAAYQEFGTASIPPRPFIGPAAFEDKDKIEGIVGAATLIGLCKGGAIPSGFYNHALSGELRLDGTLIHGATEALKTR